MISYIRLLTINTSGLRCKSKRQRIFHWLKPKNFDIMFLQETHCGSEDDAKNWSHEWGGTAIWTTFSNDSLGCAILINKNRKKLISEENVDINGRWITMNIEISDKIFHIVTK